MSTKETLPGLTAVARRILGSFHYPKTPRQVEIELQTRKLKLEPFLESGLLRALNPKARKGRLYILTEKGRGLVGMPGSSIKRGKDWDLLGWLTASPRQRIVVLKVIDLGKRTSEDIRVRATRLNPRLTRISTKGILKTLQEKGLAESEMTGKKKYYWLTEKGRSIVPQIHQFFPEALFDHSVQ